MRNGRLTLRSSAASTVVNSACIGITVSFKQVGLDETTLV
jgi:hypothetical protein